MAVLISAFITLQKLEEIVETIKAKDAKGFECTISINDESNDYGQNVSMFAQQTKEQQKAKTPKWYFGNGKVFWVNNGGVVKLADKKDGAGGGAGKLSDVYTPADKPAKPAETPATVTQAYSTPAATGVADDLPF